MSERDVIIQKADLMLALQADGVPVEGRHAMKMVRELREALVMTTSHEAMLTGDCGLVPVYFVRHLDGSFSPAVPQPAAPADPIVDAITGKAVES